MRPGFSFFICPDSALLKAEMERRASGLGANEWKRHIFWGDEEPGAPFWECLVQGGLFMESRLVIVRQAECWPAAVWKELDSALARELPNTLPFFCLESNWEKGEARLPAHIKKSRCFAFAQKKGWNWQSAGLGKNIQGFARTEAKKAGLKFSPEALERFCATTQPDATAIINELRKLALASEDGTINPDLLNRERAKQESDAFGLIQKLITSNLTGAWQEVAADTDGSLLFYAISVLAGKLRMLWQLAVGEAPRMHPAEATRNRELARRMGLSAISNGLSALANAEWQVKSGKLTPAQALESLCLNICSLFRPR